MRERLREKKASVSHRKFSELASASVESLRTRDREETRERLRKPLSRPEGANDSELGPVIY